MSAQIRALAQGSRKGRGASHMNRRSRTMTDTRALAERLRNMAQSASKASKFLAAQKTARNHAAGEPDALYRGREPEQTTEWAAAEALSTLSTENAELTRRKNDAEQCAEEQRRYSCELEAENAELKRQLDLARGTLTQRAADVRGLEEDIDKLQRVVERAISASVTVMNDVARDKLMQAISALPMRLRHAARPSDTGKE